MKKVFLVCLALICSFSPLFYKTVAQDTAALTIELEPLLAGLSSPVFITHAGDGSNRLFIVEQTGRVLVLQPGSTTPTEFLNIASKISSGGERGLLGLAFHPQFETNRRFFVDYTRSGDGATVIAEYRASQSNPNVASTTETPILTIPQPFANHNGGMLAFGPDGFLYIGMGDGGSANDPGNRAQNVNELLGKILRIDIDHPNGQIPYSSPSNNPFVGRAGRDEIFALGLRNPWRFSFDRSTGELFAGDVGQNVIEEIDIITRGGNYGWRVFEGTRCANDQFLCTSLAQIAPITEYSHTGGRCSITGGYVYRGLRSTEMLGAYFFGDFCTGEIFMLMNGTQTRLLDTNLSISSFGEDEAGEIYVVGIGGTVHHIKGPEDTVPPNPLVITSAFVRRRSTGELLDPLTTKNKGKKYEVVVRGTGFTSNSTIVINDRELNTKTGATVGQEIVGRLRNDMLRNAGALSIEVVASGVHSNRFTIEVIDN
ncbi:MAG TPA: PQQ-dependent sugar dehydrogenase [Blastocatellia bacterium]